MRSVAFRLWMGMMALVALVLALLWLFQIVFLEKFYAGIRVTRIEKQCAAAMEILAAGDMEEFENQAEVLVHDTNGDAELLDNHRNSLYYTGSNERQIIPLENNVRKSQAYDQVFAGQPATAQIEHPRFKTTYILVGLPYMAGGSQQGAFFLLFPLAAVDQTADILREQLLYITLILLAASVGIASLLSGTFTRPIRGITRVALALSRGDFTARVRTGRKDEIGQLADTINHMGQELGRIEGLRKDLISNVSHELRTPLSLIKGYAETLRDVTGGNPEKRERQLGIIIEEADRLNGIVSDILDLSQIQAGYVQLDKKEFDLGAVLGEAAASFEIMAGRLGVDIRLEAGRYVTVRADEARIRQVIHNLMGNALQHTPPGGRVTVRISGDDPVRVEVADTGSGIAPEDLPHIWDRFYKAASPEKKPAGGTGLGLSIVRGIFEAHGFRYGVDSAVGEGTVFWFEMGGDSSGR